nr:IncF plasmid conjugative transfer pilus assembly protein TraV [Klebsiella pneumoniae]
MSQQRVPAGKGLYSEFDGKPVNPTLSSYQERQYQVQGTRQAVIAPEPLAVLRQGKVMRVLIAPYTDDNDALNLLAMYMSMLSLKRGWQVIQH